MSPVRFRMHGNSLPNQPQVKTRALMTYPEWETDRVDSGGLRLAEIANQQHQDDQATDGRDDDPSPELTILGAKPSQAGEGGGGGAEGGHGVPWPFS